MCIKDILTTILNVTYAWIMEMMRLVALGEAPAVNSSVLCLCVIVYVHTDRYVNYYIYVKYTIPPIAKADLSGT